MDFKLLDRIASTKAETAKVMLMADHGERMHALDRIAERAANAIDLGSISDLLSFCRTALAGHMEPDADDPGDDLDRNEVAAALASIDLEGIESAADIARSTALDIRYGMYTRRAAA